MWCTVFPMLRRSAVAIMGVAVLFGAGCGIKGPLRLPPGATAPAPTGLPPGSVPTTTMSDKPAYTPPPQPPLSTVPDSSKDKGE